MNTSTVTPRLGLMYPAGSDAFHRQDFLDTLDALDDAPGHLVVTSTTRPTSWGASQAGRQIVETDTGRTLRWTGSAWAFVLNYGFVSTMSVAPGVSLSKGASAVYTLGTSTPNRPVKIVVIGKAIVAQQSDVQTVQATVLLDSTPISTFGPDDIHRFGASSNGSDKADIALVGVGNATAAQHTLKVQIDVGSSSSAPVTFVGAKILVQYAESTI